MVFEQNDGLTGSVTNKSRKPAPEGAFFMSWWKTLKATGQNLPLDLNFKIVFLCIADGKEQDAKDVD